MDKIPESAAVNESVELAKKYCKKQRNAPGLVNAVLRKAVEVLTHEGSGHTFAIHAEDRNVIRKFALKIPVSRFLVNTPAALGGIGATTGLFPALTLGCGAVGGSASSNNIGPLDLVNIRRVAWGTEELKAQVDSDLVELLAQKILERLK